MYMTNNTNDEIKTGKIVHSYQLFNKIFLFIGPAW